MIDEHIETSNRHEWGSPEWWLDRLNKQLSARCRATQEFADYYEGKHRLAFATDKFRQAFGGLFSKLADNWTRLVVEAVEERLNVEGFRFGDNREGDRDAWRIWQRNQLDADSHMGHTEALIRGEAYVLVWPGEDDVAEITVESGTEVVCTFEPGSRRRRSAALKRWRDDTGRLFATVYLPGAVYKFQSTTTDGWTDTTNWEPRTVPREPWPLANPFGDIVPVVPLRNRPRLDTQFGESEIRPVIPNQDAVNKLVADLMLASEYGSFRARWATGIEPSEDPETHQPIDTLKVSVDRFLQTDSADARFGEFAQTDLTIIVSAIQNRIQSIASQTRTPPHYFYLAGQFPSGDAIKSAETGLVAKTRRKMVPFGEAWEEVITLAFQLEDKRAADQLTDGETIWADPESRSDSELADAVTKRVSVGVPRQQGWEDLGYTPTQIARFKQMISEESDLGLNKPLVQVVQPGGAAPPGTQ